MRKMTKLLGAVASVLMMANVGAQAADMPMGQAPVAPIAAGPLFSWDGLYIGGEVGGAFGTADAFIPGYPSWPSVDTSGVVGGVFGGVNLVSGNLLYGIEGDFLASGVSGDAPSGAPGELYNVEENWRASVRGRLGMLMSDSILLYLTGGVSWVNLDQWYTGPGASPVASKTLVGWTLGTGIEFAAWNNWTIRGQYLFADYGDEVFQCVTCGPSTIEYQTHTITVGAAYHF